MVSFTSQSQTVQTPETAAPTTAPTSQTASQSRYGNAFVAEQVGMSGSCDWLPDFESWLGDGETPEEAAQREQQEFLTKGWPTLEDFETGTGGTFDGQLLGNTLVVTVKVAYAFLPGDPANAPVGTPASELAWTPEAMATFRADFASTVMGSWSYKHPIRSTRPLWTTQVGVVVHVIEDASDPHFTISVDKLPVDAGDGPASVCDDGYRHAPGDMCGANPPGVDGGMMVLDSRDTQQVSNRPSTQPAVSIAFGEGSSEIEPSEATKLTSPAATLTTHPAWNVEVTGRASADGDAEQNFSLARRREQVVSKALKAQGVLESQLIHEVRGEQDATGQPADRRVDIKVIDDQTQRTAAHEAGHMFGLPDEYVPDKRPAGTRLPSVDRTLLRENTSLPKGSLPTAQTTDSIMSNGMQVESWHYAPFVALIKAITKSPEWTV